MASASARAIKQSASTSNTRPSTSPDRPGDGPPVAAPAPGATVAALTAVAWASSVVAADGIVALLLDREVLPLPGAGPLLVPAMVLVAAFALFLLLVGRGRRGAIVAVEAIVVTDLLMLGVGTVGYGFERRDAADALLFLGTAALSPFVLIPAALAGVAALTAILLLRASDAGAGRPRWPWEGPDEP